MIVTTVLDFCVEEQADHTMALLLALAHKLPQMSQAMAERTWGRSKRQARDNQRLSSCVLGQLVSETQHQLLPNVPEDLT